MKKETTPAPKHLFKVVALTQWQASAAQKTVILDPQDIPVIRFLKEDEVSRLLHYWDRTKEPHVLLKIKTGKLPGTLIFEAKLGGSTKYYHLYNGSIPLSAVAEHKIINP